MLETILVTGFGPFGPHSRNISEEAARRLDGQEREGFLIRALALPVQFERAVALLRETLETEQPAAVIASGIHDEEGVDFRLELAARNERSWVTGPETDSPLAGPRAELPPVEEQGPPMVFSTLPVATIKRALEASGLRSELCDDAGRYLCNAVFYWVARRVSPAGFLHVPSSPTRLEDAVTALDLCVQETARRLIAQRVEEATTA